MDPNRSLKPKHWQRFGGIGVVLLVVALVMAVVGWLASMSGRDASAVYRLAALAGAGGLMLSLIWFGSAGMRDTADRR